MNILLKFILLSFFLSIGFNFTVIDGVLYLSNILSLIISIVIIFNLTPQELYSEKNQSIWLLIISFFVLVGMQSINGLKWLYLFFTFYSFSLFFKYNKYNLNHILLTYSLGMIVATLVSFQFIDFAYLGSNFSTDSRGSIYQLGGFNVYGVLASYAMIILIHLQSQYRTILFRTFSFLSLLLLLISQVSTLSRGGFLSLVFGLAFYSYFRKNLLKSTIGFLIVASILGLILINNLDIDFISIFNRYTFFDDATGSGRTVLWSHIFSLMSNPFIIIFGNGAGSLDLFIPVSDGNWYSGFESTHNTYLEFFYQFGLIGLSLFILFLYKTKKRIDQIILYDDQIILKTIFYVMLVNMFFDSYFFALQITALYSLFFSLFREVGHSE
jgi:O-antigen ligase